jgi:hypothetical protein
MQLHNEKIVTQAKNFSKMIHDAVEREPRCQIGRKGTRLYKNRIIKKVDKMVTEQAKIVCVHAA